MTVYIEREQKGQQKGHSKPLQRKSLDLPGRLYLGHLMNYYSLCHSSVYVHLKKNMLPQPDGYANRRPYWKTETIRADLAK